MSEKVLAFREFAFFGFFLHYGFLWSMTTMLLSFGNGTQQFQGAPCDNACLPQPSTRHYHLPHVKEPRAIETMRRSPRGTIGPSFESSRPFWLFFGGPERTYLESLWIPLRKSTILTQLRPGRSTPYDPALWSSFD